MGLLNQRIKKQDPDGIPRKRLEEQESMIFPLDWEDFPATSVESSSHRNNQLTTIRTADGFEVSSHWLSYWSRGPNNVYLAWIHDSRLNQILEFKAECLDERLIRNHFDDKVSLPIIREVKFIKLSHAYKKWSCLFFNIIKTIYSIKIIFEIRLLHRVRCSKREIKTRD